MVRSGTREEPRSCAATSKTMYENLKIKIERSGSPATEIDVRGFERELGVELPADYRLFLNEINGGTPTTPNVLESAAGVDYSCGVNEFFGLNRSEASDLRGRYAFYSGRVPSELLPVAAAVGGNLICLRIQDPHHGAVYFWDHELETTGRRSEQAVLEELSDSFSAFAQSLRPLGDDEVQYRQEDVIEAWIDPEFLEQLKNLK